MTPLQPDAPAFDHVVIGAGSAGCAVAARLSEQPGVSVLLIEAGGRDGTPLFAVPGAQIFVRDWRRYAWEYPCEPDDSRLGCRDVWRRGRILGGSSTINGLIWALGLPSDYDGWAGLGLTRWSWQEVAPFFARIESYADAVPGDRRGRQGPVRVERFRSPHPLTDALLQAADRQGLAAVDDINSVSGAGIGHVQTNQHAGVRFSSARAYLGPARRRPNLTIWTRAQVGRILFEGRQARGVALTRQGVPLQVIARQEVVLCAGAIASPQLLMLSGIGPGDHLQSLGLPVVQPAPDVGQHLQEHPELYVEYEVDQPTYTAHGTGWGTFRAGLDYLLRRRGPATSPGSHVLGYAHSGLRPDEPPDLLLFSGPWGRLQDRQAFRRGTPVYSLSPSVARPHSRGELRLRSASPQDLPLIDPRLLSDPRDVQTLMAGVRLVDRIAQASPLGPRIRRRLAPTASLDDTRALEQFVRSDASICYHVCGTCRMGVDPGAVVDETLRVRGVDRLRVADASVIPRMPSGNLNAPSTMIGERAADFIRRAS